MDLDGKHLLNEDPNVTLTIRLIMQGKEVGSIIGKKGEIVKRFREESGAKINISDGSCPERIVTVTGSTSAIFKAFTLICKKFEEFQDINSGSSGVPRPPITLRLIVPASQCGSLIGKGGSKIKEIREVTGASIQVASEMLPNSTERAVTISGTGEAITQCIYHICNVMLESPPKGATIPYRPKPQVGGPVILAGGQAYTIQGNYAVPAHADMTALGKSPLASLAALGLGGLAPTNTGGLNPAALAALAGSQLRTSNTRNQQNSNQQTHEMTVPNELIGCIIGKGGTKIAEIRQISGAMIRISNCDDRESGGTKIAEIRQISGAMIRISNCDDRESGVTDRTITISGNPDSVALAQYLINMSVELQKANLEAQNSPSTGGSGQSSTASPLASAIPLAQLLAKPGALNALTSLSALGGLTELLGAQSGTPPVQTTGVHRTHKNYTPRLRSPGGSGGPTEGSKLKTERNKFNPY
ncbi:KH domain [Popillia japonica]|uniref:KH domain n=1 Tax=Popillia japonica TaxID=7064 RepID=A0AAW1KMD7_POPJA